MTVGAVSHLLYEASFDFQSELDWSLLRDSMPAMLKLTESLRSLRPEDERLTVSLIKGYAAYGFAVWETLALEEIFLEKKKTPALETMLKHYSRAVRYGIDFLERKGIGYRKLLASINRDRGVGALLDDNLDGDDREDREAVLYLAQALGGLIHFQKSNVSLLAQLPVAKEMFDWACAKEADFNYGMCDLFYASYEAGIPRMLGGNPEKGRRIFERVINRYKYHYLARVTYIQYYAIAMDDKRVYNEQKRVLEEAEKLLEREKYWHPHRKGHEAFAERNMRAFQAIAIRRYQIIKKHEKRIF